MLAAMWDTSESLWKTESKAQCGQTQAEFNLMREKPHAPSKYLGLHPRSSCTSLSSSCHPRTQEAVGGRCRDEDLDCLSFRRCIHLKNKLADENTLSLSLPLSLSLSLCLSKRKKRKGRRKEREKGKEKNFNPYIVFHKCIAMILLKIFCLVL